MPLASAIPLLRVEIRPRLAGLVEAGVDPGPAFRDDAEDAAAGTQGVKAKAARRSAVPRGTVEGLVLPSSESKSEAAAGALRPEKTVSSVE